MNSAGDIPEQPFPLRLQKFLARAGVASRRGSEDLMTAGRVSVNGKVVTALGSKVDPKCDIVCVDGHEVRLADGSVYLMLNKPAGYLTTMSDSHNRPCVASLVPVKEYPGLFPVGRLDMDTTGLLLFTTDGDMGQHLLHPKHHVDKTYRAHVDGKIDKAAIAKLATGVELDDGVTSPAQASIERVRADGTSDITLVIHEGRKRQVKRMCSAVHHPVLELHRDKFGPLELGGLEVGAWRLLSNAECADLRRAAGLEMGER